MSDRVPPIARIRLSRSLPRLLALPFLAMLVGAAAVVGGLLFVQGIIGAAILGLGTFVVIVALAAAAVLLSIRLDVEESAVCLGWLGGERIYPLSPGPVTRVRLRGEDASRLRAAPFLLPWQLGGGRLRDEEDVEVVRLAPTATAILVPTERGRLAIAAADDGTLLDALSRAARARQRLDELGRDTPPERPAPSIAAVEIDPAVMTGIERALHEGQVAQAREAAATPSETAGEAAVLEPATGAEGYAAAPEATADPELRQRSRRLTLPRLTPRPGPSLVLLLLPLVGAGVAWGAASLLDRMPEAGTDLGRLTALGLVLAGPATTVGAIMARVWWPRLVGVVVAGGLTTAVFVGRALLG